MTPKQISERARELWNAAKVEDEWPDEMRMAYIMGACDGLRDVMDSDYVMLFDKEFDTMQPVGKEILD